MISRSYYKSILIVNRIQKMMSTSLAGGVLLILCTIIAVTLSNLDATAHWYHSLWTQNFTLGFENFGLTKPLELWINDGLMAIFFFSVGLEIKREVVAGQLISIKQASLPIAAAIGGMIVPALIYTYFNYGGVAENGWGIPMATDIAFALGILSLISKRVPLSLKIFLTALAIVDDLGAILVIAVFYSSAIDWVLLGLAALIVIYLVILNRNNVHTMRFYIIPAIILWVLMLESGIHATIAGVIIAMTMPSTAKYNKQFFSSRIQKLLHKFRRVDNYDLEIINNETQHHIIEDIRAISRKTISPIQRFEHSLKSPVAFFIMPLFALANAGVVFTTADLPQLMSDEGLGIGFGLVLGKPLGIFLFSFLAIKTGMSVMPSGATWFKLFGVACLGGIGFTMSIFIDNLAFDDLALVNYGKMSIMLASVIAGVIGCALLSASRKVGLKDSW